MTDLRTELTSKWRDAVHAGPSDREWRGVALSVSAPVRLIAAIREPDGRHALLIEAPLDAAPGFRSRMQAEGVSLTDQRRPEERIFRLAVTLEREELGDIFVALAADIVEVIRGTVSERAAIAEAIRRMEAWQACLRARRQLLSKAEQIGLIGELYTLRIIASEIGYLRAVEAWDGPLDGIHDFTAAGTAIEVKSSLGVSSVLHISHLDQLNSTGLSTLAIGRPLFREDASGETLSELIGRIRNEITHRDAAARASFDEKLLRAGYVDQPVESDGSPKVMLHDFYGFEVQNDFPRLTAQTVPAGILDASYSIEERAIAPWRIDEGRFRAIVRTMGGAAE